MSTSVTVFVHFTQRIGSAAGQSERSNRGVLKLTVLPTTLPQEGPDGDDEQLSQKEYGTGNN
jgi:hypothetical protein